MKTKSKTKRPKSKQVPLAAPTGSARQPRERWFHQFILNQKRIAEAIDDTPGSMPTSLGVLSAMAAIVDDLMDNLGFTAAETVEMISTQTNIAIGVKQKGRPNS